MKIVIIYESMYGNTKEVAEAVATVMGTAGDVRIVPAHEASATETTGADLVIVGGPTHAHGMSRSSSRKAADTEAEQNPELNIEEGAAGPGLRDWFAKVEKSSGQQAAAFDTRIDKPALLTGSAARGIAKRLRKLDFALIAAPESFFVDHSEGPLREGEATRAVQWAEHLATEAQAVASP